MLRGGVNVLLADEPNCDKLTYSGRQITRWSLSYLLSCSMMRTIMAYCSLAVTDNPRWEYSKVANGDRVNCLVVDCMGRYKRKHQKVTA